MPAPATEKAGGVDTLPIAPSTEAGTGDFTGFEADAGAIPLFTVPHDPRKNPEMSRTDNILNKCDLYTEFSICKWSYYLPILKRFY